MDHTFNLDEERAVRAIVTEVEAGWNKGDGHAFAASFADDADYVIIDGRHLKGREVIAQGHQQIFDTIYRGSTNCATVRSVYFLRDDVALVHIEWHLRFGQGDAAREGRAMNTMVMTKTGGAWSIAAFQNTPISVFNA